MLTFIFEPMDARYTCYMMNVFQGEGVAISDGGHHGDAVCDWNLYVDPRRLRYHRGGAASKLFTFQTIHKNH